MKTEGGDAVKSKWEDDDTGISDDEMLTDEEKGLLLLLLLLLLFLLLCLEKKREFREWRKAHYNEFAAVQRARELMKVIAGSRSFSFTPPLSSLLLGRRR